MAAWWYIMFVWIIAQMLGQVVEVGTGFTSTYLQWPLLANETHAAVAGGDWEPAGGRIYIGHEAIDYTALAEECPGLPVIPGPCLIGLKRGLVGTAAGSYMAGSVVRGVESQALAGLNDLRLVQTNTSWGPIDYPIQAFRSMVRLVGEIGTWDYEYLDNTGGQYLVIFMQLANLAMVVSLIGMFAGPLSNLAGGVARALTGGRFG